MFEILKNYLNDRWQFVNVSNKNFDMLKITTGVPQGSTLGPFLFLIYINDLPLHKTCETKMAIFADDAYKMKAHTRNQLNLQTDLAKSIIWFCHNKLTTNTAKCEKMHLSAGMPSHLSLFGNQTKTKDSCKSRYRF